MQVLVFYKGRQKVQRFGKSMVILSIFENPPNNKEGSYNVTTSLKY